MTFSALSHSLAFITPNALEAGIGDDILSDIEAGGFEILDTAPLHLGQEDATWLYAEECYSPGFVELVAQVTRSGGLVVIIKGFGENTPAEFYRHIGSSSAGAGVRENLACAYAARIGSNAVHVPAGPCDAISAIERFSGAFLKAA